MRSGSPGLTYLELAQDDGLMANEPTRLERLKTLGNA